MITGGLINQNNYTWSSHFFLLYPDGWSGKIRTNIAPNTTPAVGRFVIPAEIGKSYQISMVLIGKLPYNVIICKFLVKADSGTHAEIKLLTTNNSASVLCNYIGDPNSNTAKIILTNNPKRSFRWKK